MTDYQRVKSADNDSPADGEVTGKYLSMLEAGRLPRDMRWEELLTELGKIAAITMHAPDELSIRFGTSQEFFRIQSDKRVTLDDAARLRRLLHSSPSADTNTVSAVRVRVTGIIDHHQTRIYRVNYEGSDELIAKASPEDPHRFHRHLIHRKEAHYRGERVPEDEAYFAKIAKELSVADEITLIGHGTGKSNEAELLLQYLTGHDPALAKRITRVEILDLSALTEPEIENLLSSRKTTG